MADIAPMVNNNTINSAVKMVEQFVEGIFSLMEAFFDKSLDQYCRGMIFGQVGSKMLVKIANVVVGAPKNAKATIYSSKPTKKRTEEERKAKK